MRRRVPGCPCSSTRPGGGDVRVGAADEARAGTDWRRRVCASTSPLAERLADEARRGSARSASPRGTCRRSGRTGASRSRTARRSCRAPVSALGVALVLHHLDERLHDRRARASASQRRHVRRLDAEHPAGAQVRVVRNREHVAAGARRRDTRACEPAHSASGVVRVERRTSAARARSRSGRSRSGGGSSSPGVQAPLVADERREAARAPCGRSAASAASCTSRPRAARGVETVPALVAAERVADRLLGADRVAVHHGRTRAAASQR